MTDVWITIGVLTVVTFLIKAAGPVLVGGRDLPPRLGTVIALFAPALLGALVLVETFSTSDGELVLTERSAGVVAAGGVLLWRRHALLPAVVAAAVVTAALRAL